MSYSYDAFDFQNALTPTSGSIATSGSVLCFAEYDFATYIVSASCAAAATIDLTFQNASGSAFTTGSAACTASSGSVAVTQITASNDTEIWVIKVPVLAAKPWQRIIATVATADAIVSAVAFGEGGNHAKTPTQDNVLAII